MKTPYRLSRLGFDASDVASRRLSSLAGRSAPEIQKLMFGWGLEKAWAIQQAYFASAWAMWKLSMTPWTAVSPRGVERVATAALRPIERKVRSNRRRVRR